MLHEDRMCGRGVMCHWEMIDGHRQTSVKDNLKDESRRGGTTTTITTTSASKRGWYKCGRRQGNRGRRGHQNHQHHHHHQGFRRHHARMRPSTVSLRPANIKGNRAPGMRAPRNTNQFLMHEKYQMMHMRSDSVGTDSGSDCEMDFADMDSYLGVLENARGALLDSPPDLPSPPTARFGARPAFPSSFFSFGEVMDREESMQYFPSEDDVMQSEVFMQRDFNEFCTVVAPCL